ncbi:hypothetical protein ACMD2_23873 [Ananas comosus]|uniref:Uncharacterized protein n=1 Tax=Ananas comosus TaxID=4615 RepID=A0A199V3K7_ANACO|nr:hypothetical protein ACMD2_23873 [Ananas comosus]
MRMLEHLILGDGRATKPSNRRAVLVYLLPLVGDLGCARVMSLPVLSSLYSFTILSPDLAGMQWRKTG